VIIVAINITIDMKVTTECTSELPLPHMRQTIDGRNMHIEISATAPDM
jgi:hypothetical protein